MKELRFTGKIVEVVDDTVTREAGVDDQSLRNVLAILRKIQRGNTHASAIQFITGLAGNSVGPAATARVAAYIIDQVDQCREVIDNSQLVDEAKAGVRSALNEISRTFSLENMGASLAPLHANSAGYISNFVILLSASGIAIAEELPKEAKDLAAEIDEFSTKFDDLQLDPLVREIARKHLTILATLIRHIPVFGLEAALQSYFELTLKLRRADSKSSEQAKGKLDDLMGALKTWGERLKSLDDAVNTGASLLNRGQAMAPLLQYFPGVS